MPQKLNQVLKMLGLSYQDVQRLCGETPVSTKTISDVANNRRDGSARVRMRILNALNRFEDGPQNYEYDDIFEESS